MSNPKNITKHVDLPGGVAITIEGPEAEVERVLEKMTNLPEPAPLPVPWTFTYIPPWSGTSPFFTSPTSPNICGTYTGTSTLELRGPVMN